jgi:hypothetical protein
VAVCKGRRSKKGPASNRFLTHFIDSRDRNPPNNRQRDGQMFSLHENTIIYVVCPAGIVTGGIEAVHQLVHKLRQFGHDARIMPTPKVSNPVLLQYRNYEVVFADEIIDHERNILITTEVNPRALDSYYSIQKALWWLSVDNHEALADKFDFEQPQSASISHFVQSAYAASFLKNKGLATVSFLTDYLHPLYFNHTRPPRKKDIVLYTPIKGAHHYIDKLKQADVSIQWLPLTGMIRKMHAKTMRLGKVYVDFGRHPGRDRQPREAVVNGCCVIVGMAGSARFHADIPIPEKYKFDGQNLQETIILDTIRDCLSSHKTRLGDFEEYANFVRDDEQRFEQEICAIFGLKTQKATSISLIKLKNILTFAQQNDGFTTARGLMNELLPLPASHLVKSLLRPAAAHLSR